METQPESHSQTHARRDDEALLAAMRRGDETAFVALVERYHRALIHVARTYTGDAAIAEGVAQEAWIGLIESLPRFEGRASVRTWLFRILVNCARARQRHECRSVPFTDAGLEIDDRPSVDPARFLPPGQQRAGHWADPPTAWPEEHALEEEVHDHVRRLVAELPPHQRAVVTLRDIEGWSCPEVCAVMGITEGNQRVLLHRARSTIRAGLERYFLDGTEGGGA